MSLVECRCRSWMGFVMPANDHKRLATERHMDKERERDRAKYSATTATVVAVEGGIAFELVWLAHYLRILIARNTGSILARRSI